jgi:phosphoglycerate dehydrogenase-like enzyme
VQKTIVFNNNWLPQVEVERLEGMGYRVKIVPPDLTEDELIEQLEGVHAFIVPGATIVTERVIAVSTDLEIIAFSGTGYGKYIDVEAATRHGIPVTYTPGANARSVAEFAFGVILNLVRKITYYNELSRQGGVIYGETTWTLKGRTLGIVGLGFVGSEVAQIAKQGFQMRVVYFSRTRKPDVEKELGIEWASTLEQLLRQSDIVTLHPPYTKETIGMMGIGQFRAMKRTAILINVARPAMVDPHALREAIEKDLIAAAAMDGYYEEPLPSLENDKYGLLRLPTNRMCITPHVAYQTDDSVVRQADMFIRSVLAALEGKEEIPNLINPEYREHARPPSPGTPPWHKAKK